MKEGLAGRLLKEADAREETEIVSLLREAAAALQGLEGWRHMDVADLIDLKGNDCYPALMLHDESVSLPCDPWSLPDVVIEEALWLPIADILPASPTTGGRDGK